MMKTGLLWFDNDGARDLSDKISRAAEYYRRKYGRAPQLCFVNPASLNGKREALRIAGVEVLASKMVLPNHFWLGLKD